MTIETKYSLDDQVYFMRNNKAEFGTLIGISTRTGKHRRDSKMNEGVFYYITCNGYDQEEMPEKSLFKTKEELIETI